MSNDPPERRLRLALIAEHVHRRGGQERVTAELVSRLSRRHEVHLYCYSAEDLPPEVTVHLLWRPGDSATLQALLIPLLSALVVRPGAYDVVMSQGGNALRQNFVIAHTCHATRRRAAARPHPQQPREPRPWRALQYLRNLWASAMEGRAVRRCAGRVIAVSGALARALSAEHGVRREDILVAPNGVDQHVFNPERRRAWREEVRRELGLAEGEFAILFVGGMWFEKGLPLLVHALARLEFPARLVVVGKGETAALTAVAEAAGVAERVLVLGPRPDVERYYAAADCFALPSEAEGFGLVLAEAAACGLPLVATPVGIAPELIKDGVSGYLVTRDPGQIAQRLEVLAKDPALRERMGREAHRRAALMTWDRQAERIERFLLERAAPAGEETGWKPALLGGDHTDNHHRAALKCRPYPSTGETPVPPEGRQAGSLRYREGTTAQPPPGGTEVPPLQGGRRRVAVVSHSCVVDANQRLYADLARAHPELELLLIAPDYWWNRLSGGQAFMALPETAGWAHSLPVRFSGQMHLHWYARGRLGRVLEEFRPHVLLLDEEPYSLVAFQGTQWGRKLGARVLLYTKQNLFRRYPPPFGWTQKWVLRQAAGMLVVSPECEDVLARKGYRGPVTVLPHGVDTVAFSPGPGEERRRQLGLTGPVIGFAGQLEERKGVLELLEAVRRLQQTRGEGVQLVVIGDGPLRQRVEEFVADHLAPGQARVLGFISHHDMPGYLRAMEVLAVPSRTTRHWKEQFGRVLLEALACEVPVVGSDSGHIPHLIEETGGGLVFPEGDAEGLAERLGWVLDHPAQARKKGKRGREIVVQEYSSERVAERLYGAIK